MRSRVPIAVRLGVSDVDGVIEDDFVGIVDDLSFLAADRPGVGIMQADQRGGRLRPSPGWLPACAIWLDRGIVNSDEAADHIGGGEADPLGIAAERPGRTGPATDVAMCQASGHPAEKYLQMIICSDVN